MWSPVKAIKNIAENVSNRRLINKIQKHIRAGDSSSAIKVLEEIKNSENPHSISSEAVYVTSVNFDFDYKDWHLKDGARFRKPSFDGAQSLEAMKVLEVIALNEDTYGQNARTEATKFIGRIGSKHEEAAPHAIKALEKIEKAYPTKIYYSPNDPSEGIYFIAFNHKAKYWPEAIQTLQTIASPRAAEYIGGPLDNKHSKLIPQAVKALTELNKIKPNKTQHNAVTQAALNLSKSLMREDKLTSLLTDGNKKQIDLFATGLSALDASGLIEKTGNKELRKTFDGIVVEANAANSKDGIKIVVTNALKLAAA